MAENRSSRPFPWFGDGSAVGRAGKAGIALLLLGMLAGFGALLTWPSGPVGSLEFAALEAALRISETLLLAGGSLAAAGTLLYLVSYVIALIRWARPPRRPTSTSGETAGDA